MSTQCCFGRKVESLCETLPIEQDRLEALLFPTVIRLWRSVVFHRHATTYCAQPCA
ncbi:protein of unknown function [Methylorubrum extorquens]|uniref:Uncharacterized protein n=1 Tax=Methylorubrum extorquens TaxID=408 RepID=A0A2N9AH36_METEX|nr:protein of unknown function [Methylorubrum extorquens]